MLSAPSSMNTRDELRYWQKKKFKDNQLSFTRAVASLSTDQPLIDVRKIGGRWIVRYCYFFTLFRLRLNVGG